MKVVINKCYGGFSLSAKAVMRYAELAGITLYRDDDKWIDHFYTVPVEEYRRLAAKSQQLKDYSLTNAVYFSYRNIERNDPHLVQVVEEMGEESWGKVAELAVVEIPDDVHWDIAEYDGNEWIAESHRTWG